jgi:hypothetical protein
MGEGAEKDGGGRQRISLNASMETNLERTPQAKQRCEGKEERRRGGCVRGGHYLLSAKGNS